MGSKRAVEVALTVPLAIFLIVAAEGMVHIRLLRHAEALRRCGCGLLGCAGIQRRAKRLAVGLPRCRRLAEPGLAGSDAPRRLAADRPGTWRSAACLVGLLDHPQTA